MLNTYERYSMSHANQNTMCLQTYYRNNIKNTFSTLLLVLKRHLSPFLGVFHQRRKRKLLCFSPLFPRPVMRWPCVGRRPEWRERAWMKEGTMLTFTSHTSVSVIRKGTCYFKQHEVFLYFILKANEIMRIIQVTFCYTISTVE